MKVYVLDANAIISFLDDRPGAEYIALLVRQARESAQLLMSAVNWGEVFYILARRMSMDHLRRTLNTVRPRIDIVEIGSASAERAAEIKHFYKLAYADAFAAALAVEEKATLVTADPDFEKLGSKIKLKMLPRHKRQQ